MESKLYFRDCLEVLKDMEECCIDLVVTDPPYKLVSGGVTVEVKKNECGGILQKRVISDGSKIGNKWIKKNIGDVPSAARQGKMFPNNDITFSEWLPEVYRVLKDGCHCYIMTNGRNLKDLQVEAEKVGFKYVNLLVWKKNNKTPNCFYMQQCEYILLLRKGKARYINHRGTSNCFEIPNIIGSKKHPTEKPVELMKIFVENSSSVGDTVLDPFMGVGTTGAACMDLQRNFIGIEIDKEYFNIAKERMSSKGFVFMQTGFDAI